MNNNFNRCFSLISLTLVLVFIFSNSANATPPPSPPYNQSWSQADDDVIYLQIDRNIIRDARRDLDNYIGRFRSVCRFLDTMQEHDRESNNFGGLHEGEGDQLWRIVETDNTQESIRDWCLFATFFDDPETFQVNVDAAWEYAHNYPAWEESEPGEMYGLHNAGWGLMAEMAYRNAYNDSQREYGIRCAQHLVEHTPRIEPDQEDILMPLVAGWAAGTLYEYGIFEDNQDYCDAALRIADEVKEWIDADEDRLNTNEIWALCGGTAMWGVLTSLGKADSSETADWATERLDNMDVFAGRGQWNNSWNIWYCHAWIAAYQLTGEEDYLANAITIVDSLLAQDGDRDGGIPATGGDGDDRDQSWVTAYTGWMGLSNLFEVLPEFDARIVSLVEPVTTRPWPVGEPIAMSFNLINAGAAEQIDIPFHLRGALEIDTIVSVEGWDDHLLMLAEQWTPDEDGEFTFTAYSNHHNDANRGDDTLMFSLTILPVGLLSLNAHSDDNDPIGCRFDFYNLDLDSTQVFHSYSTDAESGHIEGNLMVGNYRIAVIPDFPYPRRTIDFYEITEGNNPINLTFDHPPVLLIDRDIDTTHSAYYKDALISNDRTYYHWRSMDLGTFSEQTDGFHTVIYFTGDRETETLLPADREEIESHLAGGGMLFITGQDISDDLADDSFLEDILHCRHLSDEVRRGVVDGIVDDPIMDSKRLLLFGSSGANNQLSKAGIAPIGEGIACAEYSSHPDTMAAVRWEVESGGRGIFFSFGFEAISGAGNTADQQEVLGSILNWFETPRYVSPESSVPLLPTHINALAYPNPANGSVTISFSVQLQRSNQIRIFDISGRIIRLMNDVQGKSIVWDCKDNRGIVVPSGVYYFGLKDGYRSSVTLMR
ncbi:MAG: T9SS type A sorting domain-containing protein [Candidatus Hatepunaea meridiana]|nr:T9SS type A sorting domain-containing protein [Candidatus Hatepunaea meridiana]